MSEVKVNKVSPRSGTGLQLGDSGDTITIPSGATLANNGTSTGFASIAWQSSIVTAATHTASAGQGLWLDTSSNAITLTLPSSPSVGDQVIFTDYARTWGTNAVTLNLNSEKFQGNATPVPVYDTNGESVNIVYSGSTQGWIPNSDGAVALETPQSYNIEYVIVAGGAGGGSGHSGDTAGAGGGAGGFRNSFASENTGGGASGETPMSVTSGGDGPVLTLTIGTGGAGAAVSNGAVNGVDSSISGTKGFSTLTAVGGGRGGSGDNGSTYNAQNGGSGGGSQQYNSDSPGSGTAGQGFAGGVGDGGDASGGGGGAGAVGANRSGSDGGAGGVGVSSSITGSAIVYAGGGGGGAYSTNTAGAGGSGGGGTGQKGGTDGGDGTDGLGGGGGGGGAEGGDNGTGGDGGNGVIILRMLTAKYTGTTTGSPTVTTSGSDTILKYTGTGTYTT